MKQWVGCLMFGCILFAVSWTSADEWNRSLSLGGTVTRGNSESLQLNAGFAAERQESLNKLRFTAEGAYGESEVEADDGTSDTEVTAQNISAAFNWKRGETGFVYVDVSALHDDPAEVDYRITAGPGVGWFALNGERAKVSMEVGAAWIAEDVGGVEDDYWAVRLAERWDQQLQGEAKCWQSLEYLPRIDDFDDYLLSAEVGLEAPVSARLNLRLVVQNSYDSTPAAGKEENDLTVIGGLTVNL